MSDRQKAMDNFEAAEKLIAEAIDDHLDKQTDKEEVELALAAESILKGIRRAGTVSRTARLGGAITRIGKVFGWDRMP